MLTRSTAALVGALVAATARFASAEADAGAGSDSGAGGTYRFPEAGLEVRFPAGWTTSVSADGRATAVAPGLEVKCQPVSSKTSDALIAEVKGHMGGQEFRWEKAARVRLNGRSASVVMGHKTLKGEVATIELVRVDGPMKGVQLFLLIGVVADRSSPEAHRQEIEALLNNIVELHEDDQLGRPR